MATLPNGCFVVNGDLPNGCFVVNGDGTSNADTDRRTREIKAAYGIMCALCNSDVSLCLSTYIQLRPIIDIGPLVKVGVGYAQVVRGGAVCGAGQNEHLGRDVGEMGNGELPLSETACVPP